MANLNAAFSELRQALQTVDDNWVQLAAQNAIHSWPHGANPGQLLKGAMVALQNGVVGRCTEIEQRAAQESESSSVSDSDAYLAAIRDELPPPGIRLRDVE